PCPKVNVPVIYRRVSWRLSGTATGELQCTQEGSMYGALAVDVVRQPVFRGPVGAGRQHTPVAREPLRLRLARSTCVAGVLRLRRRTRAWRARGRRTGLPRFGHLPDRTLRLAQPHRLSSLL